MTDNKDKQHILLHTCCGPCAEYPLDRLRSTGADCTLFYYNPNIHPLKEWYRRLEGVLRLAVLKQIPVYVEAGCEPARWLAQERRGGRCAFCYQVRLERVAQVAQKERFTYFSTTLLVSPYQQRELIVQQGKELAMRHGLIFCEDDFRDGFRTGQQMAINDQLYRQKYCGCCLSLSDSKFREKIEAEHARYEIPPKLARVLCDGKLIRISPKAAAELMEMS